MATPASKKKALSKTHPYRVITGQFHVFYTTPAGRHQGLRPDGDTLGFKPDRGKGAFKEIEKGAVPGAAPGAAAKKPRKVKFKAGLCSLRFEAIDAIELHFEGKHQDKALAKAARDHMTTEVGFGKVVYSKATFTSARTAQFHPVGGYIITRGVDPYGRVVSFVFAGTPPAADGATIFLTTTQVRRSVNASILAAGQAHLAFYTGLPTDLRNVMADLSRSARSRAQGIWKQPNPLKPFRARNVQDLEASKIWPKLFRRLVHYFKKNGGSLAGFDAWLRSNPNKDDDIFILPRAEFGNLHDVVRVADGKIGLNYDPSELIIFPT